MISIGLGGDKGEVFLWILSLLGIILPYSQFIPWVYENGFSIIRLFNEAS